MTTAQKPDALPVVAWLTTWNKDRVRGSGSLLSRVEPQPKYDCNQYDPLVRLSDAQAALQALAAEKDAEIAALKEDAARWRYVRHHWSNAQMFWNNDATNSLKSIVLTVKTAHWTSGASDIDA